MDNFRPASDPVLDQEEQKLIAAALDGDKDALERLLSTNQNFAWRVSLSLCGGDGEAAHELAQAALINAFRFLNQYDQRSRFRGWLYQIIRNKWRDMQRSEIRRNGRETTLDPAELVTASDGQMDPQGGDNPRQRLIARQRREIFLEILAELPPNLREVWLLREQEGLKYHEIARDMGITVEAVKSRLFKARKLWIQKARERIEDLR